ncbi:MAG: TonB-dependent receptor [Steroidobacteraceae bacterium]
MSLLFGRRRLLGRQLLYTGLILISSAAAVHADADSDPDTDQTKARSLDPVLVTAQALKGAQSAPSQGSLVATQPQSIVGSDFIQNNDSPAVNYTDIIKFTPSVWTVDPNGPGLMENQGTSIRGFQDGQFNVTLDGIPWGDSNDFTHHSTSYFMSQDLSNVVVDRGPGNAATIGDATFGGTVYMQSDDPKKTMGLTTLASFGSFNTQLYGVRADTGEISEWGGTRAFLSVKQLSSDGYLTNSPLNRTNSFLKVIQPVNDFTDITLVSNLNKLKQTPPVGATAAQMAAFGLNYGYNNDQDSQGYYNYNVDKITTDYEYIGLNSKFSGWTIDNKLYTYAYYHDGWNGEDVGGVLPNGAMSAGDFPNGTVNGPNDVPGQQLTNNYRSVGDILRLSYDLGFGEAQFGGWFDHQTNFRELTEIDFTDHQAYNPILVPLPAGALPEAAYTDRLQHNQLFTRQAYGQFIWHVVKDLDITAGDKYVNFERVIVAPVNQGTELPLDYSQTWTRNLPSLDAHYKLMDNWSAYAQWSKGFLAPNLNVLYVDDPGKNTLQPQATTNVQVGTTWVSQAFNVSVDAYTINFSNEIAPFFIVLPDGESVKQFQNLGVVKYKGVEAEGTYNVGFGLSVYANATVNSARQQSDQSWVPETPNRTAALGLLYSQGPVQASLVDKYVGVRYGDTEDAYRFGGYSTADAAINYFFNDSFMALKHAKVGLTMQNLTDRKPIYFLAGYSAGSTPVGYVNGNPMFFTVPGRSFQVNLSASF